MKNREKFREEILRSAKTSSGYDACEFKRTHVLPHFGGDGEGYNGYSCKWCYILCGLWLDEEYIEPQKPEVDWDNIAVDTPILVRESKDREWKRRYFAKYKDGIIFAWIGGNTSWTALGDIAKWKYAKLAESEEN
ncbi:MAG: hypothetical protein ACOCM4_10050 [Acetivibrio ethanolgignens]